MRVNNSLHCITESEDTAQTVADAAMCYRRYLRTALHDAVGVQSA